MGRNLYFCKDCCSIHVRDSAAKKIKSYCRDNDKDCYLVKIESVHDLAKKLRKRFLNNNINLKSFTPKERQFLHLAFEQGVWVTYNAFKKSLL